MNMDTNTNDNKLSQAREKPFQLSPDQLLKNILGKPCEQKLTAIKHYKDSFKQVQNPTAQTQQQDHHQMHFRKSRNNYFTLQSQRQQVDQCFLNLQNKFGQKFDLESQQDKVKQYIIGDTTNLVHEIQEQIKKIQNHSEITDYKEYFKIYGKNIKAHQEIKARKEQVFAKIQKIQEENKQKHRPDHEKCSRQIKEMEENYFNLFKYQLVKIALEEKLPKHGRMKYDKIDTQKLQYKNAQPLSSNNCSSMYRTIFSDKTFSGLQDGNWLHNSVIDNYIEYLKYSRGYNDITRSNSAIYSFSESKRFQNSDNYRFSSGPIFTRFQRIGLVINVKDEHWFFIGVLPKERKFIVYDSIGKRSFHYTPYLDSINKFIKREKRQFGIAYEENDQLIQIDDETTPRQENGYDCGLHVIWNLTYFLQGRVNADESISFPTQKIVYLRIGLYHFMGYLLYLSRDQGQARYDWLQLCSRSVMMMQNGPLVWK